MLYRCMLPVVTWPVTCCVVNQHLETIVDKLTQNKRREGAVKQDSQKRADRELADMKMKLEQLQQQARVRCTQCLQCDHGALL